MEVRSSRRMRTLVTQMVQSRPVRSRERTRADIHDGPEQMLQSKAGYIDARPLTASSTKISCNARPDHTLGHKQTLAELPESGRILDCGGRESGFAKGT